MLLKRLLTYCDESFPTTPLIVADSSDPEPLAENKVICESFRRQTVSYYSFPSEMRFIEKLAAAIKKVPTRFLAVCADDDFLLPGPVERAVLLLAQDPEVSCVQGVEAYFRPGTIVGQQRRLLVDVIQYPSIAEDHAPGRLQSHFGNYRSAIYGIRRTSDFADDVAVIGALQDQYMFMELAFAARDAIRGKIIRLNQIVKANEIHDDNAYKRHAAVTIWENVLFDPSFSMWLEVLLNITSPLLMDRSGLSVDESRDTIKCALREFTRWHYRSLEAGHVTQSKYWVLIKSALFKLPVLGDRVRNVWLKAAKFYDRSPLRRRRKSAARSPDFVDLVARLERELGLVPFKAIIR